MKDGRGKQTVIIIINTITYRDDTLEYLYQEYMSDDTANIQNEIEGFVSNVIYKFKTIEK